MKLKNLLYPYWGLCFLLTHLPPSSVPSAVSSIDKLAHGGGYFVLGFLLHRKLKRWLPTLFLLFVYSFFDELTQPLIGRSFEWVDLLADGLGGALGVSVGMKTFPDGLSGQSKPPL